MKQVYCIDCGRPLSLQKAIPVKWGKGQAFMCPTCYYAGAPALAPRTYNPKYWVILCSKCKKERIVYHSKPDKETIRTAICTLCFRKELYGKNPKKKPRTPKTSADALIKKEHEEEVAHWTEKLLMERYVTDREKVLYELVKKAQKDEDLIPVVRSVVSRLKLLPELEQVQRRLARERTSRNPLYERFHKAKPTLRKIKINVPLNGEKLVKLGRLIAIEYEPEPPSKLMGTVYRHQMGDTGRMILRNKPILATGQKGKGLYIIEDKSSPKVTRRGIIG